MRSFYSNYINFEVYIYRYSKYIFKYSKSFPSSVWSFILFTYSKDLDCFPPFNGPDPALLHSGCCLFLGGCSEALVKVFGLSRTEGQTKLLEYL